MMSSWTFGRRVASGFAVAGAVLVVLSVVGFRSAAKVIDDNRWVQHSHEVRAHLTQVVSTLKDVETGARGYVITGDEAFLEPYTTAQAEVGSLLSQLRSLTADNPTQQRRIEGVSTLVTARLAEAKQVVERRRNEGYEAGAQGIVSGEGKRLMDEVRAAVAEIDGEEVRLLSARTEEAQAASEQTRSVMLWGSVLGILAVAVLSTRLVRSLTDKIGTAVHRVQSSSTELQAAANQQAAGAKEQSSAIAEITTTIRQLLSTSRQIAESAKRVAQIAATTADGAQAGTLTVERAQESITVIRRQVDGIVTHMLELGRKSQQIGAVVDIVAELAEQTNILAINATIEAADAGDAGRRFAAVAEEIRKLADRVARSTKEIGTLVQDVKSSVNTTVMATETGSKAVDAGAAKFADVAVSFNDIVSLVASTTEAAREIELTTMQQTTAVEQVNVAIASIVQITRETEASTTQTLSTATQLSELSRALHHIIRPPVAVPEFR